MWQSPPWEGLPRFQTVNRGFLAIRAIISRYFLFLGRRYALPWKLICTLPVTRDKRMPDGDREDPEYG
jgi:hypothetical protein